MRPHSRFKSDMDAPLIGSSFDKATPPMVFELRLDSLVDTISPVDYGLSPDTPRIYPKNFFVTSGDAVQKARYLVKSIVKLVDQLDRSDYKKAVSKTIKQATKLVALLEEARGSSVFLETEYNSDRSLNVIPKNPRSKGADDEGS